ncbi:hypothetical protein KAH81_00855 [bacterium]|nr:hypothetical protein [bacterium]
MKKIIAGILFIALISVVGLVAQDAEETTTVVDENILAEEADATATEAIEENSPVNPAMNQTGIGGINEAYEAGAEALQEGNSDSAISYFQSAVTIADVFLGGIVDPSEEAQAKYFKGLALYYWGKLAKDDGKLDEASAEFGEAISAFTAIEKLGRFYLDSKYRRALCSYRQYQNAKVENSQIRKLGQSYGDLRDFLEDPALQEAKDEMVSEIESGNYFSALCLLRRGQIKTFDPSEYKAAKNDLITAAGYFAELVDAKNQQIAIVSKLMEGLTHYYIARLYMQVTPENWEEVALSNKERDAVIMEELETADTRLKAAKSSVGAFATAVPYIDFAILYNKIARGAAGDASKLREALETLSSQSASGIWSKEKDILAADAQLLRYFSGEANAGAAVNGWSGLTGKDKIANYWIGWVKFIEAIEEPNNYPQSSAQFNNFLSGGSGSTREAIMRADAKFRDAECIFWDATLKELAPLLQEAKGTYESLISSSGAYFRYLPEEILKQAEVRIQIIEVQQRMASGTSDINRVITNLKMQGLNLPDDAAAYLNFGQYFLEKANREAGDKRIRDVGLAIGLFNHVAQNSSVKAGLLQEAKFLKGVGYVKKATAVQSQEEASSAMKEAQQILNGVTGKLATEAKYAIGVGFFNIEDKANARTALNSFKDNYLRPAFVYGMSSDGCVTKGTYLRKVISSTDRSDTWHIKATLAFDGLECKSSIPPQSNDLKSIGSPITYESLADAKAQMDELRSKAILMWEKVSPGMNAYPADDLIPDMPPKTTILVQFQIVDPNDKTISGDHSLIIDNDTEIAEKTDGSTYRATLSRATHKIEVNFRGYYKFSEELSITEEQTVPLVLKKAVRYVRRGSDVDNTNQPMAITADDEQLFVASNDKKTIFRRNAGENLIGSINYEDIGVSAVTGLALDGDYLLVVDGRSGQVKLTTVDGSDVQPIAVKGESYGGSPLVKPLSAISVDGRYYVVDAGNSRIVVFEGINFRSKFGVDQLEHPMGIAYRASDSRLLVTDIVQGKVFVFSKTGDMIESFALPNLKSPSSIFVDPDGFILISDYVSNAIYKYTNRFEPLGEVTGEIEAPIAIAQIGSGPDATLFVACQDVVAVLKGAWDNAYTPSK